MRWSGAVPAPGGVTPVVKKGHEKAEFYQLTADPAGVDLRRAGAGDLRRLPAGLSRPLEVSAAADAAKSA